MTWLPETAVGATPFARVFGLRPDAHARFQELTARLWDGAVDPVLLELCRLRIGTLVGFAGETGGLDEAQVAALPAWPTSPLFTAVQRACLGFAEQYVLDPHGITDDDFARLHALLDAPAIAGLTLAIAVFDATARFRAALETP